MPKKQKRRQTRISDSPKRRKNFNRRAAGGNRRAISKRTFNLKLLLIIIAEFLVVFTVYQIFLFFEIAAVMWAYMIISCGLFVAFFAVNRDFSMDIPKEEQLPADWSAEKKLDFVAEVTAHRKKAKIFLIILIPFILTFLFDIISLFYFNV